MKEFLKNHFLKFGPRRFVWFAVVILLILDLMAGQFLKLYWFKSDMARLILNNAMSLQNISISDFSPDTLNELLKVADNFFYFFLFIVLLNNIFFYFFYLKRKLWAQGYVLFYSLTGAFMNVSFIFEGFTMGAFWFGFNIMTIFVYLYLYAGIKLLKNETTIPGKGKKAQ